MKQLKYIKYIFPLLLSQILGSALLSIYSIKLFSLPQAFSALFCIAAFGICYFTDKHHALGTLVIILVSIIAGFLFLHFAFSVNYGQGFRQWFLTGAQKQKTRSEYIWAVLSIFPLFFSMTIYYFGVVRYKIFWMTLICLVPCVTYIKVLSDISNKYLTLIVLLNILILVVNMYGSDFDNKTKIKGFLPILLASSVFAASFLTISALVPKQDEAPYYSRFERLFMDADTSSNLGAKFSVLNDYSGNADNYRNFLNRRMYVVYGNDVPYLTRQRYDYYDFEKDRWKSDTDLITPNISVEKWSETKRLLNFAKLKEAVSEAASLDKNFAKDKKVKKISSSSAFTDSINTYYITPENFSAVYYLTTSRTWAIDQKENIMATPCGILLSGDGMSLQNNSYKIDTYDEFESRFSWFDCGGADFNEKDSNEFLEKTYDILRKNGSVSAETVKAFIDEQLSANEYKKIYKKNNENINPKIKDLAENLTKDKKYDYEKADALQEYFVTGGFTYDLEYIADDTSPEYFLFTSKTGSCSDFASAFCLMARSIGLNARYCEGFIPDYQVEGTYSIDDDTSHAYPEVYIENTGWMVYEPTRPSNYRQHTFEKKTATQNTNLPTVEIDYALAFTVIEYIAGAVGVILFIFFILPLLAEGAFYINIRFSEPQKAVIKIYKRIKDKKSSSLKIKIKNPAPDEFSKIFLNKTGFDLKPLTEEVEAVAYGGKIIEKRDSISRFMKIYRQSLKAIRKTKFRHNFNKKSAKNI